jgi:UDP-N-acetylmuramoyl-tripeptide--D-alanyl-D-alanine ligase
VLYVKNKQDALMAIGRLIDSKFRIHCVGITGSVGKTTDEGHDRGSGFVRIPHAETEGNLNTTKSACQNPIPADPSYEAAVHEMGMQGLGEIAALAAVAQPQVGVITNIGVSHI